jgi:hypothetical protein
LKIINLKQIKMKKLLYLFLATSLILSSCTRGKRIGAICNDGWRSTATGQGACSYHGGVDYWIYK